MTQAPKKKVTKKRPIVKKKVKKVVERQPNARARKYAETLPSEPAKNKKELMEVAWKDFSNNINEGKIPKMHIDVLGNPTIGVGHLIFPLSVLQIKNDKIREAEIKKWRNDFLNLPLKGVKNKGALFDSIVDAAKRKAITSTGGMPDYITSPAGAAAAYMDEPAMRQTFNNDVTIHYNKIYGIFGKKLFEFPQTLQLSLLHASFAGQASDIAIYKAGHPQATAEDYAKFLCNLRSNSHCSDADLAVCQRAVKDSIAQCQREQPAEMHVIQDNQDVAQKPKDESNKEPTKDESKPVSTGNEIGGAEMHPVGGNNESALDQTGPVGGSGNSGQETGDAPQMHEVQDNNGVAQKTEVTPKKEEPKKEEPKKEEPKKEEPKEHGDKPVMHPINRKETSAAMKKEQGSAPKSAATDIKAHRVETMVDARADNDAQVNPAKANQQQQGKVEKSGDQTPSQEKTETGNGNYEFYYELVVDRDGTSKLVRRMRLINKENK